jgi:iron complex transport system substrate-binding protein
VRVVSLLAGATEMVCALGAGEMLVGRSHECDNPSWVRHLPACSQPAFDISVSSAEIDSEVRRRLHAGEPLYYIDSELIRELQPDLIITQSHCDVCAVTPADLERSGGPIAPRQLSLAASTIKGIFESIQDVASALDLRGQGEAVVNRERQRLETLRQRTALLRRPTVVMLEWTDPIFAMGNWGPELVEIANGKPLLGHAGEFSFAIPSEELRAADPEYLIVAPCGFNLERTEREKTVLERLSWWRDLQAVRKGQVAFADGNLFFNRSGMTISHSAEIIAEILHGVYSGAPTEGVHWRRMQSAPDRRIAIA